MGMTDEQLIKHLRGMILMKDGEISKFKEEIKDLKLVIKGMSQEYESNYRENQPKFEECEQRIIDFLRQYEGEWIEKDRIEKRLLARYPFYAGGTVPRACRSLENQGVLLVKYEGGHPLYTLNLKYDFSLNDS